MLTSFCVYHFLTFKDKKTFFPDIILNFEEACSNYAAKDKWLLFKAKTFENEVKLNWNWKWKTFLCVSRETTDALHFASKCLLIV